MRKHAIGSLILLLVVVLIVVILLPYYKFLTDEVEISPLKTLVSLNSVEKVDNKVNILILGIPGGRHDGPNLSDSITVLNYDFKKNRIITISIPRDVWSDTLRDKINSAYAYGENKVAGGGIRLAKAEASGITGLPIQYGAVIDFSGFKELINYVGGIEVDVRNSFVDHEFPIEGKENDLCGGDKKYKCRYETVSFKRGKQHMDGEVALKFVRSRNAEGSEGSDFARSRRQQEVMDGLKAKIFTIIKGLRLRQIRGLYENIDSLVRRDISNQQVAILAKRIIFGKDFHQKNFNLSTEMFEVPDYRLYDGKYVLIPPNKNFDSIHQFIECLLEKEDEKKCSSLI